MQISKIFPIVLSLCLVSCVASVSLGSTLMQIQRTLAQQERRLTMIELRMSNVLSKLGHLAHVPELTIDWWESNSNRTLNRMDEHVNRLLQAVEPIGSLQEIHSKLEQLLQLQAAGTQEDSAMAVKELETNITTSSIKQNVVMEIVHEQPAKADCYELDELLRLDGVYRFVEPEWNEVQRDFNERYCAFATDGPAWTVIQKRTIENDKDSELGLRESCNFNRSWDEYRAGFGNLEENFWFGLEFIHRIVYRDDYELRIELEDHAGVYTWAEYGLFRVDSESYNYQLVIGKLNEMSTASDALTYHNRMDFRAYKRNNDDDGCDGWWFDRCQEGKCNLNGHNGIMWDNWHNEYSVKASRMLIRPLSNVNSSNHNTDYFDYDEDSMSNSS